MLKFEKKVLELDVYGSKYTVNFPNIKQQNEYVLKYDSASPDKKDEILQDYLDGLGLPKSVVNEMYPDDLMKVVEALMGLKKN